MKDLTTKQALLLFAALALVVLVPFLVVDLPPLVDLPNHLTRCSILAELPHNPALANLYEPRHTLLPDMAMDATIVPLAHVMPVMLAGKIFCGLTLLVLFSGAFALSWAVAKRPTWWALAPALLLFNHIFSFGFLNYLLSCGLMLWAFALWIVLRERPVWLRIAVGTSFGILMFVSHLMPLALYGCAVLGWEFSRWYQGPVRKLRRLALDLVIFGSTFIVPFLMLKASPTSSELSRYVPGLAIDKYNETVQILRVDASPYDPVFTYLIFGLVLLLFVTGSLKIERWMRLPVVLIAAAFLALPTAFATTACVDMRVPILMAFLLVSGSVLVRQTRVTQLAVAALGLAFIGRVIQVGSTWHESQAETEAILADVAQVPDHSVVFSAADDAATLYDERGWAPPIVHTPLLTGATRPVFFPQIFALAVQHPLAVQPDLAELQAYQATDPKFFDGPEDFDRLVDQFRAAITEPQMLPPRLGPRPGVFVYVVTSPGEKLRSSRNAQLVLRRERYSLFKLTNLDGIYTARAAYWHLSGLVAHSHQP